jgi:hypothetical protein
MSNQGFWRWPNADFETSIPQWTEEEIDDLERRDVHSSRCHCSYCKVRSAELALDRHCRAERRAAEAAEREAAAEARSSARIQARADALREQLERNERAREPEVRFITDAEYLEWVKRLSPDVRLTEADQELLRESRRNPNTLYFVHVEPTGTVRRDPQGRTILPPDPYYGLVWC